MTAPSEPLTARRAVHVPAYALELGWAVVAVACYLLVGWYTADATPQAVANARDLVGLEQRWGVDWEHAVQDATLAVPGLAGVVNQFYVWAYFPTLIILVVWLYARHRVAYRRLRTALLASGVVGLLVYAFWPCAPPWIGGTGFTDTVAGGAFESVARPEGITNHLGAVPSFHVAWVLLVATVLFGVVRSWPARVLCVLHPLVMAYAVIATGNHWVLDVPAGLLLAATGLALAALVRRLAPAVLAITSRSPRRSARRTPPGDAG